MERFKVEIMLDAHELEAIMAEVTAHNEVAKTFDWSELGIKRSEWTIEDELRSVMRLHIIKLQRKLADQKQAEGEGAYEDGTRTNREAAAVAGEI